MSQKNFKLAEQGVAAINEAYAIDDIGPWRQHVEKVFDPELLLEGSREVFTEGDWRGHEGAIGFVANQMEVLKEMWMRLDEFIDVDENRFVMGITFGGQARHTAIPVELHPFHVFTLRDGKVSRWQVFRTREEAHEAAGLSEQEPSQENVEIVRRFLDLAEKSPEAVWDIFDDDVEWEIGILSIPDFPGRFQGPQGVREFFRRWVGPFEDWGYDVEELIAGRDAIAVRIHQWGRGKGSGVSVEDRFWQVWTMRAGKAVRVSHHREKSEALETAGLPG